MGLAVIAVGHHASERFSMEVLAERLAEMAPGISCWASRDETDPIEWMASSAVFHNQPESGG